MAILIADSGSTKTDWVCFQPGSEAPQIEVHTVGLNPFHVSDNEILSVFNHELLPQLGDTKIDSVYFYGSGVRPEVEGRMEGLIRQVFPAAHTVEAHSDLLGACRALCGGQSGIACILGTGANSCVYDGKEIVHNTPALGYILGDEGSGAVLGKHLLHDLYTGVLSQNIKATFERETGMQLSEIINKVYRQPQANRFLASLSEFIHRHLDDEGIRHSIAWYYQEQLTLILQMQGYEVGTIMQSPLQGLVAYHSN